MSIMLGVLNVLAKYANEINLIDVHFESVTGSKFPESKNTNLAANQNESVF